MQEEGLEDWAPDAALFGEVTRMKLLSHAMHEFNKFILSLDNVQHVMLPVRDGLSLLRYKGNGI